MAAKRGRKEQNLVWPDALGFSQAIKDALTHEANSLVQGISDITALAGRAGELNGFLDHDALAQKPWVKTLNEPARLTLEALVELAKGAGKAALENIQLAFFPVDSRISKGAVSDNAALMLRNLLMGHVLLDHPDKLQINLDFVERHNAWKAELNKGRELYQTAQHRWLYQADRYDRRATALLMQDIQREIKLHLLKEPLLFDYRSQRYGEVMQTKISSFFASHGQLTKEWSHQAKAWSAEQGLNAAAITWGIAAVNLLNTFATYESTTRDGDVSGKDLAKVASAAAYTGNALMAVFVETGWRGMKDLGALDEHGKYKKITQRTAAQWRRSAQPHFGKLIQGFGNRLIGLGGFTILAASVELWDIVDDYNRTSIESERTLHEVKVVTVSLMAIGGFTQVAVGLLATSGHNSYLAFVMSPWFAGATLIVGMIYLFAVFALNYLKQDIVGSWLRKCTWSRHPSEKFKTPQEENLRFYEIQLSPAVFVKPTMEMKLVNAGDLGYQIRELPSGAWVQLHIPAALRGEMIQVNLISSYRPSRIAPVGALSTNLQKPFIGNGCHEPLDQWGEISPTKTVKAHNLPLCNLQSSVAEDVIWQSWLPINEKSKYIELQIWYPEKTLDVEEADKGYRFQIELIVEGAHANNDIRLPSSKGSFLAVENLGNRDDAALLPIPL